MKLIYCWNCYDVFKLDTELRTCKCGRASGKYNKDGYTAIYSGGVPLGFNNSSLEDALLDRPKSGRGRTFEAFVIPEVCPTMERV